MKTTVAVNWDKQVSLEKSQGQAMTEDVREHWHAPDFQVGKLILLHADVNSQKQAGVSWCSFYWIMAKLMTGF